MVVNALIVWKKLIDICFFDKVKSFGIDSCLYEIPNNDWVDDMKLWPPVTFPDVYCYLIVTPLDFTYYVQLLQNCVYLQYGLSNGKHR